MIVDGWFNTAHHEAVEKLFHLAVNREAFCKVIANSRGLFQHSLIIFFDNDPSQYRENIIEIEDTIEHFNFLIVVDCILYHRLWPYFTSSRFRIFTTHLSSCFQSFPSSYRNASSLELQRSVSFRVSNVLISRTTKQFVLIMWTDKRTESLCLT